MRVTDDMVRRWLAWGRNYGEIESFKMDGERGRKWRITLPDVLITPSGMEHGFIECERVPTELMFTSREALAFAMGLAAAGSRGETRYTTAARDWDWGEGQANRPPSTGSAVAIRNRRHAGDQKGAEVTPSQSRWPVRDAASGVDVVPAEWLGLASGNQDGEAFMRAFGRLRKGEPEDPNTVPCVLCGFPCEGDQTIFAVPPSFARAKYAPREGRLATAHVACSHTMYRGRFDALHRWVEQGMPHDEMLRRLELWPWDSEEEKANAC